MEYKIENWKVFKRKMEDLGYQEVGASSVPYQTHKYAEKGPEQTAFSRILNKEVNVPYVFEKKATKITKIERVVVYVENQEVSQIRLKFDILDWPNQTDLNILYPNHRKELPPQLGSLAKEIEQQVKHALSRARSKHYRSV